MRLRSWAPFLATIAIAVAAAGCGSRGDDASAAPVGYVNVVASFYPLQYVTQRVAGDRAQVAGLTPPGAEPHDLELTPKDVARITEADLVVYLNGFQPSVDDAVRAQAADRGLDVTRPAKLDLEGHEEHSEGEEGEQHAKKDPHFWLDPTRLSAVTTSVADRLASIDPDGASAYRTNAAAVTTDLSALDAEFRAGLSGCTDKTIVTSHEAFGYLAQRYGMKQLGITGLSPEDEPDAASLAGVTDFVRRNKVRTIYYETLVSPDVARTVAQETGAAAAVLDPIEGLTEASAGTDYLSVMRANLTNLQNGQACT